jgi:hypothetical protein
MWEWYPLFHLMVNTMTPAALFAVDSTAKLPSAFSVKCHCAPSLFEYVPPSHKDKDEGKNKESSVQFSFQQSKTTRNPMLLLRRMSTKDGNEEGGEVVTKESETVAEKEKEKMVETVEEKPDEKVEEEKEFVVINGTRVTPLQLKCVEIPEQRYKPVIPLRETYGMSVIVVRDTQPANTKYINFKNGEENKVKCPEPFEYEIPDKPTEEN